jgi:hypothetical protein
MNNNKSKNNDKATAHNLFQLDNLVFSDLKSVPTKMYTLLLNYSVILVALVPFYKAQWIIFLHCNKFRILGWNSF